MMALLVLKSKIKNFYEKHYFPVRSALKTLCVFLVLLLIHTNMGYMPALDNVWLWILIAGLCGVTPDAVSCLVTIAFMTLETSGVGDDVGDIFDRHNHLSASFFSYGKKAV